MLYYWLRFNFNIYEKIKTLIWLWTARVAKCILEWCILILGSKLRLYKKWYHFNWYSNSKIQKLLRPSGNVYKLSDEYEKSSQSNNPPLSPNVTHFIILLCLMPEIEINCKMFTVFPPCLNISIVNPKVSKCKESKLGCIAASQVN